MAGTTFQREFGGGGAGSVTLANGMSIETALAPANRQLWLSTDIVAAGPELALDARVPISILEGRFGGVADCFQNSTTITVTSGSPTGTLGVASAGLAAGHTVCIDGVGNLIVASVSGTTVTFTTNAPVSGATKKFMWGTDNTTAFNLFFAYCLANARMGFVPNGRYLITGTVGIPEPGDSTGLAGLTVIWGGAATNAMRLSYMAKSAGSTVVWGGAVGGTMMLFSRTTFVHFMGGLALVGQPSHDPSSVFTAFCNRAGLGFHLSQNGTPLVGTGYVTIDEIVFGDMTQAMQFGTNTTDDNTDTSVIRRMRINRCDNGVLFKHQQCLGYEFGWTHAVSVPGYVFKTENGGAIKWGSLYFTACGTATADATADTYGLDLTSSINGCSFRVDVMRIETGTVRAVAVRNCWTHLQFGLFTEANTSNMDKTLFLMESGTIEIQGGRLLSSKSIGETPFSLKMDGNSRQPRLEFNNVSMPTANWSNLLTVESNTIMDVTVRAPKDTNNTAYPVRHTRLERGPVVIGGPTTDATTATRLDPMWRLGGTGYTNSYSPRVPKGVSVVAVTVVGDRGNNTPSVFKRRYTLYRDASNAVTVVNTETIGTDIVVGTDQIFSFTISGANAYTCNLQVKGTAATTVNWRASFVLEALYVLTPDY
jgi:hypothetical protein